MEWRALVSGLGFMFLIPRVVRISSFRCYATVGNARSCYIGVLARGEQGAMCGFDAHRVTPPLEYGLLPRSWQARCFEPACGDLYVAMLMLYYIRWGAYW